MEIAPVTCAKGLLHDLLKGELFAASTLVSVTCVLASWTFQRSLRQLVIVASRSLIQGREN